MAYITPYMTSNDLVASVQRKISMPLSQNLFTAKDILAFANEELFIAQVPSVLEFHEEYFVFTMTVPIIPKIHRYPIPTRAIGMKLRDVKWQDSNKNLFDMSRVNPEDKAFYQQNIGTSETISKYYIEGNDLVLLPALTVTNSINLIFYYFLRPNQLVANERAAIITAFTNTITVLNANIVPGDTITINSNDIINKHIFTAVSGLPTADQFQIAGSDIATANNLVAAINLNGLAGTASNGSPATSLVTISFNNILMSQGLITSNPTAFIIPVNIQAIQFDQLPSTYQDPITFVTTPLYTTGVTVDFLQTNPGHRTYAIDVPVPLNSISGTTINFVLGVVPTNIFVGDYIALANECIIPQIPPDLHTSLAQRTATMILGALGDQAGLQASALKVQEMEKKQISLLDARVEGSALKIANKKSLLRFQGMGSRRRRL
jgi:hypothetical protein